jgi:hypothetical protein
LKQAIDIKVVNEGRAASIRLSPKALREYEKVRSGTDEHSVKRKKCLERYFQMFCGETFHRLTPEQFKWEGSFANGKGTKTAVWVFKVWQWRLYGGVLTVEGKKCFVGVLVDPAKKQNKADPSILAAAAKEIADLEETLGAKNEQQSNADQRKRSR